ncbi:hypothetical protein [Pontibaca methylaminivorans]|uniref:hypothetical protein n=1 Tax=Pontibaca methylaminivorans TaxID=515897 RepID=UPI002FD9C108
MKRFLSGTLVFGALILAEPVLAGPIDRACRQSARAAATSQLCGCLQSLADTTLKRSDHRRVARFFNKPDKAQKLRQSNRRRDAELWQRYRGYADLAEQVCRPA